MFWKCVGGLCAVLLVSCAAVRAPSAEVIDLSLIGRPASAQVRTYEDDGSCPPGSAQTNCRVTSPAGVEYETVKGVVCNITVAADKVTQPVKLPYGLTFGMTVEQAMAAVPKGRGGGRRFDHHGRTGFETGYGAFGDPEGFTAILLWFDINDRLNVVNSSVSCPGP